MSYTTYFEIGGHTVECEVMDDVPTEGTPISRRMVGASPEPSVVSRPAGSLGKITHTNKHVQKENTMGKMLARGSIRAGVAILSVPDPLPFVDELAGVVLIGVGAGYLYATNDGKLD